MSEQRRETTAGQPVGDGARDPHLASTVNYAADASSVGDPARTVDHVSSQRQPGTPAQARSGSADAEAPAPVVPGYEILGVLGRGGMGVVYKARQVGLNRLVALKMIRAGSLAGPADRERFRIEAEAVARLHHPNIVQIYEVGEVEGNPYFSLEFVGGGSLSRLRGTPLPPRPAAQVIEALARATHHAHQLGIVHRDLKPANVLLQAAAPGSTDRPGGGSTLTPSLPDSPAALALLQSAVPKISDFGLAKRLDEDSGQTRSGELLGTPSYMAPEQAAGLTREIGPPCDVYALGAILYECLTGRPPFRAAGVLETLEQVRTQEPVRPRQLQPRLPAELETITLKCLEKDPRKRYGSAEELGDDLRRFLNGEPILARPAGAVERAVKWARRKPAAAALWAVSIAALVGGLLAGVLFTRSLQEEKEYAEGQTTLAQKNEQEAGRQKQNAIDRANEAKAQEARTKEALKKLQAETLKRQKADAAREKADADAREALQRQLRESQTALYGRNLAAGLHAWEAGDVRRSRELLDLCPGELRGWEWQHLSNLNDRKTRVFSAPQGGFSVAFTPDGKSLVTGSGDRLVRLWDVKTGQLRHTLSGLREYVKHLAVLDDGKLLQAVDGLGNLHTWDLQGKLLAKGTVGRFVCIAFSHDNRCWAWVEPLKTDLSVWRPGKDKAPRYFRRAGVAEQAFDHGFLSVAFSPDARRVAAVDRKGFITIWDVASGSEELSLNAGGVNNEQSLLAFSPDGRLLVSPSNIVHVSVWDVQTGEEVQRFTGHQRPVSAVAFLGDGRRVVSGGGDNVVKVWDVRTGALVQGLTGHDRPKGPQPRTMPALAVHPDGVHIASACRDDTVRLWDVEDRHEAFGKQATRDQLLGARFLPGGHRLLMLQHATGAPEQFTVGQLTVVDLKNGAERQSLSQHYIWRFHLSDKGVLALANSSDRLELWDAAEGRQTRTLPGLYRLMRGVIQSPDGRWVAGWGESDYVVVWETGGGKPRLLKPPVRAQVIDAAFSHDSARLAVTGEHGLTTVWDVAGGKRLFTASARGRAGSGPAAYSPDGKFLVSSLRGAVRVGAAEDGKELHILEAGKTPIGRLLFTIDGRYLAGVTEKVVRVWDTATWKESGLLELPGAVTGLAFSPNGNWLACSSADSVRVWKAGAWKDPTVLTVQGAVLEALDFDADSRRLLACARKPAGVVVWETGSWRETHRRLPKEWTVQAASFWKDGMHLALRSTFETPGSQWPRQRVRVVERFGRESATEFSTAPREAILALDPRALRAAVWSPSHTLALWDFDAKGPRRTLPLPAYRQAPRGAFSRDGRYFACAGSDNKLRAAVRVWVMPEGKEIPLRQEAEGPEAQWLTFSPDGKRLLVHAQASRTVMDYQLLQWHLPEGRAATEFSRNVGVRLTSFTCAAFSPTRHLVAVGQGQAILLLDADKGTAVRPPLTGHAGVVGALAFSPDGRRLVSSDAEQVVKTWDTATWQELQAIRGVRGQRQSIEFSPDGRQLVLFGDDNLHLLIYDAEPPAKAEGK